MPIIYFYCLMKLILFRKKNICTEIIFKLGNTSHLLNITSNATSEGIDCYR